jgi:hypothetical protein
MAFDERAAFVEKPETRQARFACPRCRRTADYGVRWVRRTKKSQMPSSSDPKDRERFAKLRDHLLRLDEHVTCKACNHRFEIPSQQSLIFVDQLEGLPNDDELEREIAALSGESGGPAESRPALPPRFTRKSTGWK